MREYTTAGEAYIGDIEATRARHFVWVEAKNRGTGETEAAGFWNGSTDIQVSIDGVNRTYVGAGALLDIEPIRAGVGLDVRMHELGLSAIPDEVRQAVFGYDPRLAPVEVHRGLFNPDTNALVAEPQRVLKGTVEGLSAPRAAEGGTSRLTLTVASAARSLTRGLTLKKSDAAQRAISATDRGREYASISGAVGVFWGVKHARATPPPTTDEGPSDREENPGDYQK